MVSRVASGSWKLSCRAKIKEINALASLLRKKQKDSFEKIEREKLESSCVYYLRRMSINKLMLEENSLDFKEKIEEEEDGLAKIQECKKNKRRVRQQNLARALDHLRKRAEENLRSFEHLQAEEVSARALKSPLPVGYATRNEEEDIHEERADNFCEVNTGLASEKAQFSHQNTQMADVHRFEAARTYGSKIRGIFREKKFRNRPIPFTYQPGFPCAKKRRHAGERCQCERAHRPRHPKHLRAGKRLRARRRDRLKDYQFSFC